MEQELLVPQPYLCVRFNPDDVEVFDTFVSPFIAETLDLHSSLMFTRNLYGSTPQMFVTPEVAESGYFKPGSVWLLVTRVPKRAGSLEANRSVGTIGVWRKSGKESLVVDSVRYLGTKQKYRFFYTHPAAISKKCTGWEMCEYTPSMPEPALFQPKVAVYLTYTPAKDAIRNEGLANLIPGGQAGGGGGQAGGGGDNLGGGGDNLGGDNLGGGGGQAGGGGGQAGGGGDNLGGDNWWNEDGWWNEDHFAGDLFDED